jgi:hypothetical protein
VTEHVADVRGSVDRITVQGQAVTTASPAAELIVEGWGLVDENCPSAVVITADGKPVAVTTMFLDHAGQEGSRRPQKGCGWRAVLRAQRLSAGRHVIGAVVPVEGGVSAIGGRRNLMIAAP